MRRSRLRGCAWVGLYVVLGLALSARASWVDHPLPGHSSAIAGYTGTTHFSVAGGGKTLDIDVDYAVFSPHSFPGTFLPYSVFIPFGPPGPDDFIYAYQAYNTGETGALPMDILSVGIQASSLVTSMGRDAGFDPATDDVDATFAFLGSDGAKYFMIFGAPGTELRPGQFSVVFLISSPNPPTMESSYVTGGPLTREGMLPSPVIVPLPSSLASGLVALAAVLGWMWWRKRSMRRVMAQRVPVAETVRERSKSH